VRPDTAVILAVFPGFIPRRPQQEVAERMPIELPDRKYLLMLRAPLVDEYVKKWKQWRANCFDETLIKEKEQLGKKVREKWNARIYWPEATIQGVSDFWLLTSAVYVGVRDERDSARR